MELSTVPRSQSRGHSLGTSSEKLDDVSLTYDSSNRIGKRPQDVVMGTQDLSQCGVAMPLFKFLACSFGGNRWTLICLVLSRLNDVPADFRRSEAVNEPLKDLKT